VEGSSEMIDPATGAGPLLTGFYGFNGMMGVAGLIFMTVFLT